jgi:transposase InsO family protein
LRRYEELGEEAFVARSRRPHSSPNQTPSEVEDEIVFIRKTLSDEGFEAGVDVIRYHLAKKFERVPARSTIHRILVQRGFITPQPKKRPKSSYVRFEAALPNECWQSDFTHYRLADGTEVEIVNWIDDHSRLVLSSTVTPVTSGADILATFRANCRNYGTPYSTLTDNGRVYTTTRHGGNPNAFERELIDSFVEQKNSRFYHPQTCGKVERFHQTLKRHLNTRPAPATIAELQAQIDRFCAYYNEQRPHRSLGMRTPREAYDARTKAHPIKKNKDTHYRIRTDKIDRGGRVTLRYSERLHHIGIGRAHAGKAVKIYAQDLDVRVIDLETGELLAKLTLDITKDYQPIGAGSQQAILTKNGCEQ